MSSPSPSGSLSNVIYFSPPQFFQRVYDKVNVEPITYGLAPSCKAPRAPFIFHNYIPPDKKEPLLRMFEPVSADEDERRRSMLKQLIEAYVRDNIEKNGSKFKCRLDGKLFATEEQAIVHIRDTYRTKIENLLQVLVSDLEQDHLGFMFTKLLYPDVVYSFYKPPSLSTEFPSSLAPDLTPGKLSANAKKREKKKQKAAAAAAAASASNGVENQRPFSFDLLRKPPKDIYTEDELLEIEQLLYGADRMRLVVSKKAVQSTVTPKVEEPPPAPAPVAKTKQTSSTSTKDKGKAKAAEPKAPPSKPVAKESVKDAKKLERERQEREKEQKRVMAELLVKIEEEAWDEIEDEVVEGLLTKMVARVCQEVRSASKHRDDSAEESQREALREKKHQERKLRREMRIKEGDRIATEVEEEVIEKELTSIARAALDELFKERSAIEKAKRREQQQKEAQRTPPSQSTQPAPNRPSYSIDPNAPSFYPASYRPPQPASGVYPSVHAPSAVATNLSTRSGGAPQVQNAPGVGGLYQRPSSQPPYSGYPPSGMFPPSQQVPSIFSGFPNPAAFTPSEVGGEPPFYAQLSSAEYPPGAFPPTESMFTGSFGFFAPSSQSAQSLRSPTPPNPQHGHPAVPPLSRPTSASPVPSAPSPRGPTPTLDQKPLSPRKKLSSSPEDVGFVGSRTVVCSGIPVYLASNEEIATFFRDCKISGRPDTSLKIHFLKPPDVGCCFVELATDEDCTRGLAKNGRMLRDVVIEVSRPAPSGPPLASPHPLLPSTYHAFAKNPSPIPTQQTQPSPSPTTSFAARLTRPDAPTAATIGGAGTWGGGGLYSLSTMLNTAEDKILSADEVQRAKFAPGAVGSGKRGASPEPYELGLNTPFDLNGSRGMNGESPRNPIGPSVSNPLLSSHLFNPSPFELGLGRMGMMGIGDGATPGSAGGAGLKRSGLYGSGEEKLGLKMGLHSLDEDDSLTGGSDLGLDSAGSFYSIGGIHDVIDEEDEGESEMRIQFNFMDITNDQEPDQLNGDADLYSMPSSTTRPPPGLKSPAWFS